MPKLVALYIRHTIIGFIIAAVFVALLLWFDVVGLRHLVTHTEGGYLAVFLLVMFNGIVFSGVQFGIAVMNLAEPEERGPGGGRGAPVNAQVRDPSAIPVVAEGARR